MILAEGIYACLAAPLAIAALCSHGRIRVLLIALFMGVTACLLSSYVSTFLAGAYGIDLRTASLEVSPLVEEALKLAPVLFWLLVFEPGRDEVPGCLLMVAVGFATFENVCYLAGGAGMGFVELAARGLGTGALHVACGALVGAGLVRLQDEAWLRAGGTVGLFALAVTLHGVYNVLVSQAGIAAYMGFALPIAVAVALALHGRGSLR